MSAKYMILGSLMESPVHGYDLKKRVFKKVFSDFGINDGQLYPLLKRLEGEGLISKEVIPQEGAPSRHKYFITDAGRAALVAWLEDDSGEQRAMRYDFMRKDEFFTRCNYLRHLEKARAVARVERQIDLVRNTLDDFSTARARMIEKNVDPYRIKLIEYGICNQKARLEWLQDFLADIKKDRSFNQKWKQNK